MSEIRSISSTSSQSRAALNWLSLAQALTTGTSARRCALRNGPIRAKAQYAYPATAVLRAAERGDTAHYQARSRLRALLDDARAEVRGDAIDPSADFAMLVLMAHGLLRSLQFTHPPLRLAVGPRGIEHEAFA